MLYVRARLFLIALFMGVGILLQVQVGWKGSWYLYAAGLLLLLTHLRFGPVWAAFVQLRQGKLAEAERLLKQVWQPAWLARRHRAYFYFTKGMLAIQHKQQAVGCADLQKALDLGLRSKTDEALALLNVAFMHLQDQRYAEAQALLDRAKSLEVNDLLVKQNIQEMEAALIRQN